MKSKEQLCNLIDEAVAARIEYLCNSIKCLPGNSKNFNKRFKELTDLRKEHDLYINKCIKEEAIKRTLKSYENALQASKWINQDNHILKEMTKFTKEVTCGCD